MTVKELGLRIENGPLGRILAVSTVVFCVLIGAFASFLPEIATALASLIIIAGVGYLFVGGPGLILLLPVVCCFALLVRFNTLLAIPAGRLQITAVYWLSAVSLGLISLDALARRRSSFHTPDRETWLVSRISTILILFACVSVLGLAFNHLFGSHISGRSVGREILALGAILIPMGYAIAIPSLKLSKRRVLMCIRGMVLLGAATGLLMAVFGLAADLFVGLLGWVQAAPGTLDLARGRTPLGHPNTVAAVLQMLLVTAMILGLRSRDRFWRPFYLLSAAVMVMGILFSLSRAALSVTVFMVLLVLAYLLVAEKRLRLGQMVLGVLFTGLLVLIGAYLFTNYDFSRFWSRKYFEDASVERRVDSMNTALLVWRDHPLFGSSPGSVYLRQEIDPENLPDGRDHVGEVVVYRGNITAVHPHNMYLAALAEFGLLGGGLLFFFLASVALLLYRFRCRPDLSPHDREVMTAMGFGFLTMLLTGMAESMFIVNLRYAVICWTFVGLAIRYGLAARTEFGNQPATSPSAR